LFDDGEFTLNARETSEGLELWAANSRGNSTMRASATW
jgi:3-methylfumaryl-CoA hydratase